MEENANLRAYSYHTFYFPFVWDLDGSLSMDDFVIKLTKDSKWKDISVNTFADAGEDKIANYQSLQYFTPAARKSLFGWDEKFVKCFEYSSKDVNSEYCIKLMPRESESTDYYLRLDGIKLKIYNTGIGVLTFEVENYNYKSMVDVKKINECGRRIFATFFENGECYLCARELGLKVKDKDIFSPISQFKPQNEKQCIPGFITYLLPDINIVPAIDDRMFVACLVNDSEEFKKHIDYRIDEENKIKEIHLNYADNDDASKSLYEFIYIDKDDYCSCPTKSVRNELLSQSIYKRWAEYTCDGKIAGTIHGITHHSMVCLTTATEESSVERPFLTIYTHMISAVLAQRASIIAFDSKISNASKGFESDKNRINLKRIKALKKLQDTYIAFLNQHMNIEITCQEQGIELYKMLQNEMYVREEEEMLSKEIQLLNDTADIANEIRINKTALFWSILFGITSLQPLISFFEWFLKLIGNML